jgi:hypothetical protein
MYKYFLPLRLQQEKKTPDVALVFSMNVLMREKVTLSTARLKDWYKHNTARNFMSVVDTSDSKQNDIFELSPWGIIKNMSSNNIINNICVPIQTGSVV